MPRDAKKAGDAALRKLAPEFGLDKGQTADLENWLADWHRLYLEMTPDAREAAGAQRKAIKTLRNALADALRSAQAARPALLHAYPPKRLRGNPGIEISGRMQLSSDLRAMQRLGRMAKAALGAVGHAQGRKSNEDLVEAAHALFEKLADIRKTTKKALLRGLRSYKGRGEQLEILLMHALRRIAPDLPDEKLRSVLKRAATAARKTA